MREVNTALFLTATASLQLFYIAGTRRSLRCPLLEGGTALLFVYIVFADIGLPQSAGFVSAW